MMESEKTKPIRVTRPGIFDNLDHSSPMIDRPYGMEHTLGLYQRTACMAMVQLELHRAIHMIAGGTSLTIPGVHLEEGDIVEIPTRYGFYSDPPESQREMTIVALIMRGSPPDMPREIHSFGGLTVRLLSTRKVSRTNLIIVPRESFVRWKICLESVYLCKTYILCKEDMDPDYMSPEGLSTIDVFLLCADIYPEFREYSRQKGIHVWGRVIIEESETSTHVNSMLYDERSEFEWRLHPNPVQWIENPCVEELFRHKGIISACWNYPAIFTVRNNPVFLARCLQSFPLKDPEPHLTDPISRSLGRLSLNCYLRKAEISRENIRRVFDLIVNDLSSKMIIMCNRDSLHVQIAGDCGEMVTECITRRPCLEAGQDQILRHNIHLLVSESREIINDMHRQIESVFEEKNRVLKEKIDAVSSLTIATHTETDTDYFSHMNNMIESLISAMTTQVPTGRGNIIPLYVIRVIRSVLNEPVVRECLENIFPGYIGAYGSATGQFVVSQKKGTQKLNMVIALAHGLAVMAKIDPREGLRPVVLVADGFSVQQKQEMIAQPLRAERMGDHVIADTYIFDHRAPFRLVKRTRCLVIHPGGKVTEGSLPPGMEVFVV